MNELNDKLITDYLGRLPSSVTNAVTDKTWSTRTGEVALKYSLSEEQTTVLKNLVLFVIIGIESPETFSKSVEVELSISNLLTEQLVKDLDNRVFQYIVNSIQEKTLPKKSTPSIQVEKNVQPVSEIKKEIPKDEHTDFDVLRTMSKDIEYIKNNQDPVMHTAIDRQQKPAVTPVIPTPTESSVERKIVAAPNNLPGIEVREEITPEIKIGDLGDSKVFVGSEFIKQSAETKPTVPENPKTETPKWGSNINNGSTSTNPEGKPVDSQEKISVPRYTSDPYREPIE